MALTREQYQAMLMALLPPGSLWARGNDAIMADLLLALAAEFERLDLRADLLINESDVRFTTEILEDWERVAGLPDSCSALAATTAGRRQALTTRITGLRNLSKQTFITIAATLDYTITIDDNMPYELGHFFNGSEITAAEWVFVWRVNGPLASDHWARAGQAVAGDAIRIWGNEVLECVINKLKPAHTHVLFSYS